MCEMPRGVEERERHLLGIRREANTSLSGDCGPEGISYVFAEDDKRFVRFSHEHVDLVCGKRSVPVEGYKFRLTIMKRPVHTRNLSQSDRRCQSKSILRRETKWHVDERRHPLGDGGELNDVALLAFAGGELIFVRGGGHCLFNALPSDAKGGNALIRWPHLASPSTCAVLANKSTSLFSLSSPILTTPSP